MAYLLFIFIVAWAWQTWRKRVWKKRFTLAISEYAPVIANAFAEMWAASYREQMRNDWPEEIETK